MKRQNRTVGFLLIAAVLLAVVVWAVQEYSKRAKQMGPTEAISKAPESMMGPEASVDVATNTEIPENSDAKKVFAQIVASARACLGLPAGKAQEDFAASAEGLQAFLIRDFGPIQKQADRWMAWHLKNADGRERRLRLEVAEKDGEIRREMHHFAVDREGTPIPLEVDPEVALNPSDDEINQLLKEGDVFYKEKSSEIIFGGGRRLTIVEADGGIGEFEIENKGVLFHCPNLKSADLCICTRGQEPASP